MRLKTNQLLILQFFPTKDSGMFLKVKNQEENPLDYELCEQELKKFREAAAGNM